MLAAVGAPNWKTDAHSDAEGLAELLGRLCYRSYNLEHNANLTRVREGNAAYIENIIRSRHGSVIEHPSVTYAFLNVTRVFTHEIVRHRAGAAYSQESLRFVRLDRLNARYPDAFGEDKIGALFDALPREAVQSRHLTDEHQLEFSRRVRGTEGENPEDVIRELWVREKTGTLRETFTRVFESLETEQREVARLLHLDALPDGTFQIKKELTSAMRRLAPIGLCTHIGVSGNHRAWRHWIGMRCTPHAEEEIREVLFKVAMDMEISHPALYADMLLCYETRTAAFEYEKV